MAEHRAEQITRSEICERLGIGKSQFYAMRTSHLLACAQGGGAAWEPQCSGGKRHPDWPDAAQQLARKLLQSDPPASYSSVASELHRRLRFATDRSNVRRWAAAHDCALAPRPKHKAQRANVRRWQRQSIGELWQMDATPHAFVPGSEVKWHLIDIIDDCSRLVVGARMYEREVLPSYYDILPRALLAHGLPLAFYVDYHSFFHTHTPDALTELGRALRFYGVSLQYASTPQAKGKVERLHHYWQNRLPPLFGAEGITSIAPANALLEELREHHNSDEQHRELSMTPAQAWQRARRAKRNVLRPCKRDPWWHYIWSQRSSIRVADDGTVPVDGQRLRISAAPRTRLVHCLHTNGSITILANKPIKHTSPKILLHYGPKLD
jgi:transposase InsO family protein